MGDSYLRELTGHLRWADERVWDAVLASPAAMSDAALTAKLHHLHSVQRAFLRMWTGAAIDIRPLDQYTDLAAFRESAREIHREITAYLESATDRMLNSELTIPWASRIRELTGEPEGSVTIRQSAVQVAMHSAYHRGQVNTRLRELGGEPPLVDFIAWVWMKKPVP